MQRYAFLTFPISGRNAEMVEIDGGEWCLYSDAQAALAEKDRELAASQANFKAAADVANRELAENLNLKEQIAALTAENERQIEALREIASGNRTAHESVNWARQALQAGKGEKDKTPNCHTFLANQFPGKMKLTGPADLKEETWTSQAGKEE